MDWSRARNDVEARLATICTALPEVHEGPTFNGRSWLIRKNHFCQIHTMDVGEDQRGLLVFRSEPPELGALVAPGYPFYQPGWGARVVAMHWHDHVDWDELAELIVDSYCIQAPRKLAALVR